MFRVSEVGHRLNLDDLAVRVYVLLVAGCFAIGVAVLVGNDSRFEGPSFEVALALGELFPLFDAHTWWALLFLTLGGLLIATLGRRIAVHVLRFGFVVFTALAFTFILSAFTTPTASLAVIPAFLVIAGIFVLLGDHIAHKGWA